MRALPATTTTTITSAPLPPHEVGAAVALDERPQYRYAGDGRFLPANEPAREECWRWNEYAAVWNARTVPRSVAP